MRISDWSSDVCSSDLPAVIEIAALETREHLDMLGIEGEIARRLDPAKARSFADIDRQRIDAVAGRAVEQDIALPDLGEGVAFLGQLERDRRFGALNTLRDDRFADAEREIFGDQLRVDRRIGDCKRVLRGKSGAE